MNKFLSILTVIFFMMISMQISFADTDYEQIYRDLEPADFSYVHNVDPGEMYDVKDTSWSPYPLFRLSAPLFFKNTMVEPGYYLLTPREHKGNWYVFLYKFNCTIFYPFWMCRLKLIWAKGNRICTA